MHYRLLIRRLAVAALAAVILAGCSPEAGRPRGGGMGASSDNLPAGGVVPKSKLFNDEAP